MGVKNNFGFRPGTLVTDQTGDMGYSPRASSVVEGGPHDAVGEDRLDVRTSEVHRCVSGVRHELQTARPPRSSFSAQQRAFDRFQLEYNEQRPHEALGQVVPASLYRPSLRSYPRQLPEPEYPAHCESRVAYPNGVISFGTTQWYVSGCLAGERLGLEPCDDGRWRVHFARVPIGLLDLKRANDRGARQFGMLEPIVDPALSRRRRRRYGS